MFTIGTGTTFEVVGELAILNYLLVGSLMRTTKRISTVLANFVAEDWATIARRR
ncbi:hypothetical protein J31TS6_10210 [Brevibacillus reuszeri]|nr:hypothetical protein J31TS6_10210 [Brevibacillus reuszeri]